MPKTAIRITLGSITLLAWIFLGAFLLRNTEPRVDPRPFETGGKLMAQQALALLDAAGGGQISVIARDTATFKNPASDIQLAAFFQAVQQAHATLGAVRRLHVDPLRPIAVPSSEFRELIENTGQGSVIVSFMGPPVLTDSDRARLGEIQPAIVAFCSGGQAESVDLRALFQRGLLKAAVVDRRGSNSPGQSDPSGQPFQTLTAANFPGLAARQTPNIQ